MSETSIPSEIKELIESEANWRATNGHGGVDQYTYDVAKSCLEQGYQLSQTPSPTGDRDFWTEEMILRFAELYRWSSGRITMRGFKESPKWHPSKDFPLHF